MKLYANKKISLANYNPNQLWVQLEYLKIEKNNPSKLPNINIINSWSSTKYAEYRKLVSKPKKSDIIQNITRLVSEIKIKKTSTLMSSFVKLDKPSRTLLPPSPKSSTPRISISPPPSPSSTSPPMSPNVTAEGTTYATAAASRLTVPPISNSRQLILKKLRTGQNLLSKSLTDFKGLAITTNDSP